MINLTATLSIKGIDEQMEGKVSAAPVAEAVIADTAAVVAATL
jgi:hypothetical protein